MIDNNRNLASFDAVVAVGTKSREIGENLVSVTVAALLDDFRFESTGQWQATVSPFQAFEFRNATVSPELAGWYIAIFSILPRLGDPRTVALIVDSFPEKHAAFNSKSEPFIGKHYLPDGVELIHVSNENSALQQISQTALAEMHRRAAIVLDKVEASNSRNADMRPSETSFFESYRIWNELPEFIK